MNLRIGKFTKFLKVKNEGRGVTLVRWVKNKDQKLTWKHATLRRGEIYPKVNFHSGEFFLIDVLFRA